MRKIGIAVAALTLLAAGFVVAQTREQRPLPFFKPAAEAAEAAKQEQMPPNTLRINEHLALRIAGMHDGRAMGTLLTKVDGKWIEVMLESKNIRAAVR